MNCTFTHLDLSNPATAKEDWAIFKKEWDNYLVQAEAGMITGSRISTPKVNVFNTVLGKDGIRLIENLVDTKNADLDTKVNVLDNNFIGSKNALYERVLFNNKLVQNKNKPIKDFIGRFKEKHI